MRISYILLLSIFSVISNNISAQSLYFSSSDTTDAPISSFEPKGTDEEPNSVFSDFTLHRNYPNPITGYLTVHYEVNSPGHYVISVVGYKGKEIKRLIDSKHQAGTYKFNWLASPKAQGIYMYRVVDGKRKGPRRLLLLY